MDIQVQDYLRQAASRARTVEQIGTFLATFTHEDSNPYLNYAIPDRGATPLREEIDALIDAFRRHHRTPRLEYVPGLAPSVEPALTEAGFVAEGRIPLMVYARGTERSLPVPPGIEIIVPRSDEELFGMISAQNEAYGGPPPTEAQVARRHGFTEAGGISIFARSSVTHEPAGGGLCDVPFNGIAELTSVGVRPSFRGLGIAGAMTVRLTQEALAAGTTTIFLMAAIDVEVRLYTRAGFSIVGEVLLISVPDMAGAADEKQA